MTPPFARRLRAFVLAACALAPACAVAQQSREPSEQERASFAAWYQQQRPTGMASPVYSITRDSVASPWRVQVHVDAPARRALRTLCRMDRQVYTYDGQWRSAPVQQFAWHAPSGCAAPARRIALGQRMPDTDILALIAQQDALLARARLIFAGNTACAAQRAYPYRLSAIDVSIYISGSEEMATLTYHSDRGPVARVWVRRTGLAYDPWNVSCP